MIEIKFKAKIRQWSNSFIATIPMSYIDNKLLEEGKTYEFVCKEVDHGSQFCDDLCEQKSKEDI
jgi:hypothetical protein